MKYLNKLYSDCKDKLSKDITKSLHYLCKTSDKNHSYIAARMNLQLEYLYKENEIWLNKKLDDFSDEKNAKTENFNGFLGEVRTYGELLELNSIMAEVLSIETPNSGSDFLLDLKGNNIHIEVHSPQSSSGKKTTSQIEESRTETSNHTIDYKISSSAPYGYPVRKVDNIQYEAVSKFAQIKSEKENKQFVKDEISILWLDLNFPDVFMFNQLEYTVPVASFNGQITSGFIWNAFYGLKGDKIYSTYGGFTKDVVDMEFNGRFYKSKIDFVVADCFTHKVIFENFNSNKEVPKDLYRLFLHLHNINNRYSYLSYGEKEKLQSLIKTERESSNNLVKLFN